MMDQLCKPLTVQHIPIITTKEKYIFWYMENTAEILGDMFERDLGLWDILTNYRVLQATRKVPKYLMDHLDQARNYGNKKDLPLVCLGHKGSKKVITYTQQQDLP